MDRDARPGPDARSVRPAAPSPTARTTPASSWPSTAGTLRATYQSVTSDAHTPHASTSQTTSPGPGSGSGASSIRTSRGASDRATLIVRAARRPSFADRARDAALGHERGDERGRRHVERRVAAPRAGERERPPRRRSAPRRRRAPRSRSRRRSDMSWSTVDVGPATTNGIPAARAASAVAYVPTLLATSPLAATRSQPTITASTSPAAISPARGGVDHQLVRDPEPPRAPRRSAARPAAAGASRWRAPRSSGRGRRARRPPPARCPGRAPRARRCCSGSGCAWRRASSSAPLRAIASLAASSSASIARASRERGGRAVGVGAREPRRATRSTAQARLTAVGPRLAQHLARAARARRRRDRGAARARPRSRRRPRSAARRGSPGA